MILRKKIEQDSTLESKVWGCLRSIALDDFENEGRVYGGGLRKIEPRELGNIQCKELDKLLGS